MSVDSDVFAEWLLPNEKIVWSGRPVSGILFRPDDVLLIPFTFLWTCGAIFMAVFAARYGAGPAFVLPMTLFVMWGLAITFGRFWFDAWLRGNTRYALTESRLLIFRPKPFGAHTAVSIDHLPKASLSERKDGGGSIRFGRLNILVNKLWGWGSAVPILGVMPQVIDIPDARRVFELVEEMAARG